MLSALLLSLAMGQIQVPGTTTVNATISFDGGLSVGSVSIDGGSVAVTSLPSLPAGSNQVGSVFVDGGVNLQVTALPPIQGWVVSDGGTSTANQGTPNTAANSWTVEQTDGTNVLGTSSHPTRTDPTGTTTQPVSAASLPLPSGAATSANQTNNSQTTQVVNGSGTQLLTDDGATSSSASESATVRLGVAAALRGLDTSQTAGSQLVPLKATSNALWVLLQNSSLAVTGTFWQATQPVSLASLPALASGTNTIGYVKVTDGTNFLPTMDVAARKGFFSLTDGTNTMPTMDAVGRPGFFKLTDGTNTAPTMDAAARKGFFALTDGTNTATVKPASTAPATTDTALVVTESPLAADTCTSFLAISQTASTDILTSTNKLHICAITLVSDTAQFVNLIEGTGTTCATSGTAILGSTTAGSGMSFAANGGVAMASGKPFLKTKTTADHLCVTQSGSGRLSGFISYVDQ